MSKLKIIILLLVLLGIITIPDILLELLHGLLELIIEAMHILFEVIESALDNVIEHTLNTGTHQTQIIVFYIIALIALYGLVRLWRIVPRFCGRCKDSMVSTKAFYKVQAEDYWSGLQSIQKLKMVGIGFLFLTVLFFLLF